MVPNLQQHIRESSEGCFGHPWSPKGQTLKEWAGSKASGPSAARRGKPQARWTPANAKQNLHRSPALARYQPRWPNEEWRESLVNAALERHRQVHT